MEISLVFRDHPVEDTLEEYALGRLSDQAVARLEEHLLVCVPCQDRLEELDQYIQVMKSAVGAPLTGALTHPIAHAWQHMCTSSQGTAGQLAGAAVLGVVCAAAVLAPRPLAPGPPVTVALASFRSVDASATQAPARRPLDLSIRAADLPAAPEYHFEVVNGKGKAVWNARAVAADGRISARVDGGLRPGFYWVRVSAPGEGLLSEFGMRLE